MDIVTLGAAIGAAKKDLNKVVAPVSASDAGKIATVDSNGKYVAAELEVGQGEVAVDSTLLVSGAAADAQVTGDKVNELKSAVDHLEEDVKDLADAVFGGHTWQALKELVDSGEAAHVLQVGDQITDSWEKAANTSYVAPWDVVHHMPNGDVVLNWHYAIPDAIAFDAPEAIYYAPEGGLAAGQYYIGIGTAYGTGWVTTKHINFTLTSAMDEGDQLYIECSTNNANDPTAGATWKVFAQGSTTAKQTGTTSDSDTGTSLGTIGATNAHKPEGHLNAISRVVYGYGRWSQSAIRQWLNSTAAANAWWTPQNPWDRPPSQHSSVRGFLAGLAQELQDILVPVDVVTALNTQEGFAEDTETTQDKIFLPSLEEMYITPQLADVEGVDWDYNKALAAEAGLTGKFAQYGTYEILKKYQVSSKTSAVGVWLRSCIRGSASYAWYVTYSGYVSYGIAYNASRGCPACIIKKSV